jgi:hypothetical protein
MDDIQKEETTEKEVTEMTEMTDAALTLLALAALSSFAPAPAPSSPSVSPKPEPEPEQIESVSETSPLASVAVAVPVSAGAGAEPEAAVDAAKPAAMTWTAFVSGVSRACGGLKFDELGPFASALKARTPMGAWKSSDIARALNPWRESKKPT